MIVYAGCKRLLSLSHLPLSVKTVPGRSLLRRQFFTRPYLFHWVFFSLGVNFIKTIPQINGGPSLLIQTPALRINSIQPIRNICFCKVHKYPWPQRKAKAERIVFVTNSLQQTVDTFCGKDRWGCGNTYLLNWLLIFNWISRVQTTLTQGGGLTPITLSTVR